MGELAVLVVVAVLVLLALLGRPATVLGVLVGTTLVVPAALVVPHLHSSLLTVDNVVLLAALLRVVSWRRRGELPRAALRLTPLHAGFAVLAVSWFVLGGVLGPDTSVPHYEALQLVSLLAMAVAFGVCLVVLRQLDRPMLLLQLLSAALVIECAIAVVEHVTGQAFGRAVFDAAGQRGSTLAAATLEPRNGHLRVRASGDFALSFSWIVVMAVPALTVVVLRLRRWLPVALPALLLVTVAVYWTYSRSAAAALPGILVVLGVVARNRRLLVVAALIAVAGGLGFAASPALQHHLSLSSDQGSVAVRFQRIPPVLDAVAHRPWTGLGFGGVLSTDTPTTDNSYLLAYAQFGALGAAAFLAFLVCAFAQAARGLLVSDPGRRLVAAAAFAGLVAFGAAGGFEDAFFLAQAAQLAALLLAAATYAAEPELGVVPPPRWSLRRTAFLTAVGASIGAIGFAVAPVTVSEQRQFLTVPVDRSIGIYDTVVQAQSLIGNVCAVAPMVVPDRVHVDCRDDFTAAGLGTLRITAPSAAGVSAAYSAIDRAVGSLSYLTNYHTLRGDGPVSARATLWGTAPATGAMLGLVASLLLPLPLRRRRRPSAARRAAVLTTSVAPLPAAP